MHIYIMIRQRSYTKRLYLELQTHWASPLRPRPLPQSSVPIKCARLASAAAFVWDALPSFLSQACWGPLLCSSGCCSDSMSSVSLSLAFTAPPKSTGTASEVPHGSLRMPPLAHFSVLSACVGFECRAASVQPVRSSIPLMLLWDLTPSQTPCPGGATAEWKGQIINKRCH